MVFGQISKDRGQYDQAIAYIERSLTMYVSLYGDSRSVAISLFHLAEILSLQENYLKAGKKRATYEIRETKLPTTHCEVAQSLYALG